MDAEVPLRLEHVFFSGVHLLKQYLLNLKMLPKLKSMLKDALASIFFSVVPRRKRVIDQVGINFVGFAKAEMGLGEALRSLVGVALRAKIPFLVRDFDPAIQSPQNNRSMDAFLEPACRYPINCLCINPDLLYRLPQWLRYDEWGRGYNVGYWFWELPNFPKSWRYATAIVDEVWVNSEYVASSIRQASSNVIKMPFAVEFSLPSDALNRNYFGVSQSAFLFLFSYDFLSSSGRKNPAATLEAFLKAFPANQPDDVGLIIKSVNGSSDQNTLDLLREKFKNDSRIKIVDRQLSTEEMHALIQCCNSYVSLHRAEGLGLGMAEAMYLGKPVIATAYSGNMEFMNEQNACLVPYRLIDVKQDEYPNAAGQVWADPDIDAAAHQMKKVYEDPEFAASIGKNAADYMREHHSVIVAGNAISERLEVIQRNFSEQKSKRVIPKSLWVLGHRGLQSLISLVTMLFIARYLSPESQGWYYAFLGLASLYTLADLGLSVALVPYFARSFAASKLEGDGRLTGPESELLIRRLGQSFDWYIVVAILYVAILIPFGAWFFGRLPEIQFAQGWFLPWTAIVVTCAGQLLLLPLTAFVEAAGQVVSLSIMRMVQIALGGVACWALLYLNQGLWAAVVVALSGVLVPLLWLVMRWPRVLGLLRSGIGTRFSFTTGISGVQWRIAVSWICAYLSSQIYGLILMQLDGPVVSGQLSLSIAIANMVGVLALSSMAGKIAFVGHDAARNDLTKIKVKFKEDFLFFSGLYALGALFVLVSYLLIQDEVYATRVLSLWQIISLLGFMFVVNLMNLFSTYVRSYLREPFMRINLIGTLLTLPLAYFGALYFSSTGVVLALISVALFVTLPFAVFTWRKEIEKVVSTSVTK